ncbi:MAG: protein adenylyltransferase SelO [Prochlorotrichaceae cyanobacterium]
MSPFLNLTFEPSLEALGDAFYASVAAANFPQTVLRFRNDRLLPLLGLNPETVSDADFTLAFGEFKGRSPLLALSYHGYQFGVYNPYLGDGRGFLYGQVRGTNGVLYDLGTKGSGQTPYSRGGDGRLTLKGGVREVLAAEALAALGVKTSRCLSLIETGEGLWRGDEPSPTRSSVMVRFSQSHIRFGTFERLHYLKRSDLIQRLLDHVIRVYYPDIAEMSIVEIKGSAVEATLTPDHYLAFYRSLVERVADLAAQWMSVGFCHGVLNTDNMSITGESFDYGPYAFIPTYDLQFTAAYFDDLGRYCFGNQPPICKQNLQLLQVPLSSLVSQGELERSLAAFDDRFRATFMQRMLHRLGFATLEPPLDRELVKLTLELLQQQRSNYHGFFRLLRQTFSPQWVRDPSQIPPDLFAPADYSDAPPVSQTLSEAWCAWRDSYHLALSRLSSAELAAIPERLAQHNPLTALIRPEIETVWAAIDTEDNWQPFYDLIEKIRSLH